MRCMTRKNIPMIPGAMERKLIGFGRIVEMPMGTRFVKRKAMNANIAWMPGLFNGNKATPIAPIDEAMIMKVIQRRL